MAVPIGIWILLVLVDIVVGLLDKVYITIVSKGVSGSECLWISFRLDCVQS